LCSFLFFAFESLWVSRSGQGVGWAVLVESWVGWGGRVAT